MNAPTEFPLTESAPENQTPPNSFALMMSSDGMERVYKFADMMAQGVATVPLHLQGKQADCFAVALQAFGWEMNPFAVAQKTHVTQGGALGYEAQLVNAVVITRAPIKNRPDYEFLGDWSKILGKVEERKGASGGKYYVATWKPEDEVGLGIVVRCTLKGESEPRTVQVMMSQAWPRFSTQWATDPQQQISYLAVRKWARRFTPDVILGVYTKDELDEVPQAPRDMGAAVVLDATGTPKLTALTEEQVSQWRAESKKGTLASRAWLAGLTREQRALATAAQKAEMWALAEAADKSRTVDNPPAPPAPPAQAAPRPTASAAADADGVLNDPFVADMQAEETRMSGGAA